MEYRNQLSLRILLLVNQQYIGHDEALSTLHSEPRDEITEVVTINYQRARATINQQHSQIASAIFTTRGGGQTALTNPLAESEFSSRLASGEATRTSITYSGGNDGSKGGLKKGQYGHVTVENVADYRPRVISSLHFQNITLRRSAIPKAHTKTFEWVWHGASTADEPDTAKWDPLGRWLRASSSTSARNYYWVSGKAGSGKSSLMKYLEDDPRTIGCLRGWAGTAQLIIASFYFWYTGTPAAKIADRPAPNLAFQNPL